MILRYTKKGMPNREVVWFLYTTLVKSEVEYCDSFWCPNNAKEVEILKRDQRRLIKMIRGLENRPYSVRPEELSSFISGRTVLRDDLISAYRQLQMKMIADVEGAALFSLADRSITRSVAGS